MSLGLLMAFMEPGGGPFFSAQNKNRNATIVTDKFAFSGNSHTCAGWVFTNCDPVGGAICTTSGSFATITTFATSNLAAANGFGTQGFTVAPFNDCAGGTNAVMFNSWFSVATYDHTKIQFRITGLNSGKTYTLSFAGATTNGTVGARVTAVRLEGAVLSSAQTFDPGSTGAPNNTATAITTFTGIAPNGSGQIDVFVYKSGSDRAILSAMTIANEN